MSNIVLKAENISKQYRLGQLGTGSIVHDLNRAWARMRGKEDPYLKIGDINDRSKKNGGTYVWSLKDINFEVKRGEVLGIIGKNGAGKSTLLKILSQVTTPTTGSVKVKGRIAALLEVGTGFHPDLSGLENIYLNGAILGMTKSEIKSKLDEIIEFSGVAKYLDTPVKRYSSGMMVRLGFAVAAHLEPEILIVDEVLAVGDAEFQKKCLGKMKDVSSQGRTVLFVSHNMEAVKNLTHNSIILKNGEVIYTGDTTTAINTYLKNTEVESSIQYNDINSAIGNEFIKIRAVKLLSENTGVRIDEDFILEIKFWNISEYEDIIVAFDLCHISGTNVFSSGSIFQTLKNEITTIHCTFPANLLNDDTYSVHLMFFNRNIMSLYEKHEIISFEMEDGLRNSNHTGKINGVIRPKLNWVKL